MSSSTLRQQLLSEEYPFPHDEQCFECAERVYKVRREEGSASRWKANVNLIFKQGKKLDVKILASDRLENLPRTKEIYSFSDVQDSLDVVLGGIESPRFYYQVLYREGQSNWNALAPKSFRVPVLRLEEGARFTVLFLADDHTFDDGDHWVPEVYKEVKLSGDYVNEFLKGLRFDPSWRPPDPLGRLRNGYTLATTIRYIMAHEDPDLVINLGDTPGVCAQHKWVGLGLPAPGGHLTDKDYNYIAQTMWLRMRKMYSGLTPHVPMYMALGNHDGETGWNMTRFRAREWRQKLFTFPDGSVYPENGHPQGNYFGLSLGSDHLNRGGVQFIVLDVCAFSGDRTPQKIEQWTLGEDQLAWLEDVLKKGKKDWVFICFHHVLGGWPAGPDEGRKDIAYGRGPLFSFEDYLPYANPNEVEQVKITGMAKEYGVRAFLYGHDHIFHAKNIGQGLNEKNIFGICCGTPKYVGEDDWWQGNFWRRHYGDGFKSYPDFWGPPGMTKLIVNEERAKLNYIVTAITAHTNLPPEARVGDVLESRSLANPLPFLLVDKESLSFRGIEEGENPPSQVFRVKNRGARALHYLFKSSEPWLTVSPEKGSSWGEWDEITVSVDIGKLTSGTYQGVIRIESDQIAGSPKEVKVNLLVADPPIHAVLNFTAVRRKNRSLLYEEQIIIMTWEANPLNKNIQKYRIFMEESGVWKLQVEVGAWAFKYIFRNASRSRKYRFGLAALDQKNRMGEMAIVIVH